MRFFASQWPPPGQGIGQWKIEALGVSRDPDFYFVQAERLVSEGKFSAAELMLRQACELAGGNNRVYVAALGTLLGLQEGRAEESLSMLEEQLAATPEDPSLLIAQALTAKATGRSELATESLKKVVELDANHAFAHHSLGRVLKEQGQLQEAEIHACKAFALGPDQPDYALEAISLLESAGKHDYAFEVASLGASFCPQEMELVQKAVQGALAREEPQRAWEALEESNDELPWVLGWKANLLEHQGHSERADALLAQGREQFGEEPEFLFLEAAILVRRELQEAALEVIERLLEIQPTHRGALRLRADLSFQGQASEEALADLRAMLELDPGDDQVAQELVSLYYRAHRYREALDICQDWQQRPGAPPQLDVHRVLSLASLGEMAEALAGVPEVPTEMVTAALSELAAYGCGNAAEQAVREQLLERLGDEPAAPAPAPSLDLGEEDAPQASDADSEGEESTDRPKPKVELPRQVDFRGLLGESPAYDEDELEVEDDEELWVEVDEDGEEYVWVDDDEEEEQES